MRRNRGLVVETCPSPCKETTGSSFLLDSVTSLASTSSSLWSGRSLLLKGGGKTPSPTSDKSDLGSFEEPFRRLSFTDEELMKCIDDSDDFRNLQEEMRKKGAVTNTLMKEGIHFWIQNLMQKRQSDSPSSILATTSSKGSMLRPFQNSPRR